MDNWFLLLVIVAMAIVVFVYLRLGEKAALVAGAALALLLAFFRGRMGAKQDAENEVIRGELKNEKQRNADVDRANAAADRVAVGSNDPDKLRSHDPFERR